MMAFVALIKAVLSWPVAVVVIALAYKSELLKALPDFLRRKLKLEGFGIKAEIDAAEQQQVVTANPAIETLPQKAALDPSSRATINIMEVRLRGELESIDADKKQAILLRALATSRLEYGHEFTYNRIFGSQIAGLKRLNEASQVTVDQAREFFRPYAEQFPQIYSTYGFDGWLGFLTNSGLVGQNGVNLTISEFGRDFLVYLTERRLTELKPW